MRGTFYHIQMHHAQHIIKYKFIPFTKRISLEKKNAFNSIGNISIPLYIYLCWMQKFTREHKPNENEKKIMANFIQNQIYIMETLY